MYGEEGTNSWWVQGSIRAESMARALGSISLPPCGCNCSFRQRAKRCEGRERRSNLHLPKGGGKNRMCASEALRKDCF